MGDIPYLERAARLLSEPFFIFNSNKTLLFANKAFYSLLGVEGDAIRLASINEFWPKSDNCNLKLQHLSTEFTDNKTQVCRVRLALSSMGEDIYLARILGASAFDAAPKNSHLQRLETLGLLASGIAHDFNNMLAGVLGHVTYLKAVLPGSGPHLDSLKAIEDGVRKSAQMTQQILGFSRMDAVDKVAQIDLGELIVNTCKLLRGAVSARFNLACSLPETSLHVLAVESRLAQILVNLVINARDALSPGGSIEVALSCVTDRARLQQALGCSDLPSNCFALITVTDNGHGMSADVRQRALEPYFSTKEDRGTGLGLALVDSIVKFYGGVLEIESEEGRGTTVSVYLPALEQTAQTSTVDKSKVRLVGGKEKILVVDDESPVRNVLGLSLRHLGYEVELAGSGTEALEKYGKAQRPFDLVLLDMLMPELSGAEVFERLRQIDPKAAVLVISGFASADAISSVLERGGRGFMQKPFTIEELAQKVRACLVK